MNFKQYKDMLCEEVYNLEGKNLTKKQMLDSAVAKEIVWMGNNPKIPTYHAVMKIKDGGDGNVFKISLKEFEKLKVKDITTDIQKQKTLKYELKKLIDKKLSSMSDQIAYNNWYKKNNKPPIEKSIEYLKKL